MTFIQVNKIIFKKIRDALSDNYSCLGNYIKYIGIKNYVRSFHKKNKRAYCHAKEFNHIF